MNIAKIRMFIVVISLVSSNLAAVEEFSYSQKNSVRFNPSDVIGLVLFFGDHVVGNMPNYYFDVEYTRNLKHNYNLMVKASYIKSTPAFDYRAYSNFLPQDAAETNSAEPDMEEIEIEIGARKLFPLLGNKKRCFSLFPHASLAGSYGVYDISEKIIYGTLYLGGGAQFTVRRFIVATNMAAGYSMFAPSERGPWTFRPHFVMGFSF